MGYKTLFTFMFISFVAVLFNTTVTHSETIFIVIDPFTLFYRKSTLIVNYQNLLRFDIRDPISTFADLQST